MSTLLDGFAIAKEHRVSIRKKVQEYLESGYRAPKLAVVLVGNDPASETYVASKSKQAKEVGFDSLTMKLDGLTSESELIEVIDTLNEDVTVDGILVQLPLPKHINEDTIIERIRPSKDVDGLTPYNVAMLNLSKDGMVPCTPKGIITLLDAYNINLEGKRVLVIGRSRLVGKPIANLMISRNATVTVAHSKTKNIEYEVANHDIIVVAIGKKEMIKASWISSSHIIVDVGIHRNNDGTLSGDVEREAYAKALYATPVPRGVGPMTIVSLLENTLIAYAKGVNHE